MCKTDLTAEISDGNYSDSFHAPPHCQPTRAKNKMRSSHDRRHSRDLSVIMATCEATPRRIISDSDTDHGPSQIRANVPYCSTPNGRRSKPKNKSMRRKLFENQIENDGHIKLLGLMKQEHHHSNSLIDMVSLDIENNNNNSDCGYCMRTSSSSEYSVAVGTSLGISAIDGSHNTKPVNVDMRGSSHNKQLVQPMLTRRKTNNSCQKHKKLSKSYSLKLDSEHFNFMHKSMLRSREVVVEKHSFHRQTSAKQLMKIKKQMQDQSHYTAELQTLAIL